MAQQQQLKDREKNLRKWVQLVKVVREDAVQVLTRCGFDFKGTAATKDVLHCTHCGCDVSGFGPTATAATKALAKPIEHHRTFSSNQESGLDCPLLHMEDEAKRLAMYTGKGWPHTKPSAVKMAQAGFAFQPTSDAPDFGSCSWCDLGLDGWEPSDDPTAEHKKRKPNCPFFKLKPDAASSSAAAVEAKPAKATGTRSRKRGAKDAADSESSADIAAEAPVPVPIAVPAEAPATARKRTRKAPEAVVEPEAPASEPAPPTTAKKPARGGKAKAAVDSAEPTIVPVVAAPADAMDTTTIPAANSSASASAASSSSAPAVLPNPALSQLSDAELNLTVRQFLEKEVESQLGQFDKAMNAQIDKFKKHAATQRQVLEQL